MRVPRRIAWLVSMLALRQCARPQPGPEMATLSDSSARSLAVPSFGLTVGILAIVTLLRLVAMRFSVVDLFYDESQYWAWSRELAFGYFSKPPLLAWIIAASEHVCGSG